MKAISWLRFPLVPRRLSAGAAAGASSDDRVELTRGPAAPAAVAHPEREHLCRLRAQGRPLTLEEAQELAPLLKSEDPIVVRLAQNTLQALFDGKGALQHWRAQKGETEGPAWFLEHQLQRLRESEQDEYSTATAQRDVILPFLEHLAALPQIPERLLRVATHLWTAFSRRAAQKLEPDTRAEEPVEVDRELARRCRELVRGWLDTGAAEGDFEALQAVASERPIPVRGKRLLLPAQGEPPPGDVAALMHWVDAAPAVESTPKLTELLKDPAQRQRLRPYLAQLREQTSRALATSELGTDARIGDLLREYYEQLVEAFPETLDAALVTRQMMPIVLCDEVMASSAGHNLLYPLWEKRPDLVAPVMDALTRAEREHYLPDSRGWLVSKAIQLHGYKPSPRELDWIASWLYLAPGPHGERRQGNRQDYRWAAATLMKLEPQGLTLPDRTGREVPAGDAVLDALLDLETADELLDLHGEGMELAFSQPGLRDRVQKTVEGALDRAGGVEALSLEDKGRLVLLHNSAGRLSSLESRLARELQRPQTDRAVRRVVDDYRKTYLEAGTSREKLREYLRVNALFYGEPPEVDRAVMVEPHLTSQADTEIYSKPQIEAFAPASAAELLAELRAAHARAGGLAGLSPDGIGALQILDHLSEKSAPLRSTLLELVQADLRTPAWKDPHVLNRMLRRLRADEFSRCLKAIGTTDDLAGAVERARAIALADRDREREQQVWDAFTQVCRRDPEFPRVDLEEEELLALYGLLRRDAVDPLLWARNCRRFEQILSKVDGSVETAIRIYRGAGQSSDWDSGYRLALQRELGAEPSIPAGKIVVEQEVVRIGPVCLKRKL